MNEHFVWEGSRVMINMGEIPLPFPIQILGLILAPIMGFYGYRYLQGKNYEKKTKKQKKELKKEEESITALQYWALVIVSLVIGQLLFMLFPSPEFSALGPIKIRWYGVLFALGFITGYGIEYKFFQDAKRPLSELDQLLTYILIATIVGARLGHVLFYDIGYYLSNPVEIIAIWHGGLASHGAAIAILIAMYLFVKKHKGMTFLWLADRLVVAVALAGAFIRIGNFFNSEILGRAAEVPWAVIFAKIDMVPRHPTMLYEALLCLVVLAILVLVYYRYKTTPPEGAIFGLFLTILFGGRFLLEYTKVRQAAFAGDWALSMGQWLSVPLILFGLWLIIVKVDWKKGSAATN